MKAIIKYVYTLPSNKKNVPELITDPIALIKDVRTLIEEHCHDNPDRAITGRPVLPPQVRFIFKCFLVKSSKIDGKMLVFSDFVTFQWVPPI